MCVVTKMFPFHHLLYVEIADWGPGFAQAASLVETACAGFTPPPGERAIPSMRRVGGDGGGAGMRPGTRGSA
jgi:hypothetical protein